MTMILRMSNVPVEDDTSYCIVYVFDPGVSDPKFMSTTEARTQSLAADDR